MLESPVARIAFERELVTATVPAHRRLTVEQSIVPTERGLASFGTLFLRVENAVGLLQRRIDVDLASEATVMPDLSAVERYGTLARRTTLIDVGLRRLRQRGAGSEFESLREYVPGDAFRSIDWKATARRGHAIVVQREPERSQQVLIALDCGRLMIPRIGALR